MKIICGKSIAINPPMRRLPLSVGFHALTNAARFAEEIIERSGRFSDGYADNEAFAFLKDFNRLLEDQNTGMDEMTVILRLMITKQLILTNRITGMAASELSKTVDNQLELLTSNIRSTDLAKWHRILEYRSIIEYDEKLSKLIRESEVRYDGSREILSFVDMGALDQISLKSSFYDAAVFSETEKYSYSSSDVFVFKTQRADIQDAPNSALSYAENKQEIKQTENASSVSDFQKIISYPVSGSQFGDKDNTGPTGSQPDAVRTDSLNTVTNTTYSEETTLIHKTETSDGDKTTSVAEADSIKSEPLNVTTSTTYSEETTLIHKTETSDGDKIVSGTEADSIKSEPLNVTTSTTYPEETTLIHKTESFDGDKTISGAEADSIKSEPLNVTTSTTYSEESTLIHKTDNTDGGINTRSERLADSSVSAVKKLSDRVNSVLRMNSFASQGAAYFTNVGQRYKGSSVSGSSLLGKAVEKAAAGSKNGLLLKVLMTLNGSKSSEQFLNGQSEYENVSDIRNDYERTEILTLTLRRLASDGANDVQNLTEDETGLLELLRKSRDVSAALDNYTYADDNALAKELVLYYHKGAGQRGFENAIRFIGQAQQRENDSKGIYSVRSIALVHPMLQQNDEKEEPASPAFGYSGYPLITVSGRISDTPMQAATRISGQESGQYLDTAAVLSYSGRRPPSVDRADIINSSTPRTKVVPKEELISRFGNLIDGADPNKPSVSVGPVQTASSGALTELSAKITKMDEQTKINTKQLDEIAKKQREFEAVTLKSSDIQQLSNEVLSRLKSQLRHDKSRYS